MPDRFLTISDAQTFTAKSRSTLRRFIEGIVKADNSPDRHLLLPTIAEVTALREQNQPFSWRISEELLRRQFLKPDESAAPAGGQGSGPVAGSDSSRLVTVLEKSIAMLERELSEKNNQIAAMNDRMRESNILMKDLQQRLALPAPHSSAGQVVAERSPSSAVNSVTPSASRNESSHETPPRKSRFGWLFGA